MSFVEIDSTDPNGVYMKLQNLAVIYNSISDSKRIRPRTGLYTNISQWMFPITFHAPIIGVMKWLLINVYVLPLIGCIWINVL